MQPVDVTVQGMALNTFGLTANDTIAGLGLNTFGFLWPCSGIWTDYAESISTTWTNPLSGTVEVCLD